MHTDMTRVNAIWQHPLYQQNLKDLIHLEADRIFCRHTPEHFLDVARLAYIFALERGLDCSREQILSDLAFSSAEKEQILTAIGEHRSSKEETSSLSRILYEADKKSRMCFLCPAEKECYWDLSKKNMMIQY